MNFFAKAAALCLAALSFTANAAGIDGRQIGGVLGINYSGGAFAPGFITQVDMGSALVGPGPELSYTPYNTFDFSGDTLTASFSISAASLPFNGFLFRLTDPSLNFTSFHVSQLDGNFNGSLAFQGNALAINLAGVNDGTVVMKFTTAPAPVPEPETYTMLMAGLGLLGFTARRRKNSVV